MSIKVIIIILVAVLSGIFFWQTTNRFLYPSKAAGTIVPTSNPLVPAGSTKTGVPPATTDSTPVVNPTDKTMPPTGGCPGKSMGDFNCDGKIDLLDFDLFRREFTGSASTKESDANGDSQVDLVDFDIFRRGMFL